MTDRRKVIKDLYPQHLRENKDFNIFIELSAEELGLVGDYIEIFNNLGVLAKVPDKYLKDLSDLVAYPFSETHDYSLQREAIKRIFTGYKERGTEESILKAADYSVADDWVAGDIFLTKDNIPDRTANVIYTNTKVFRHNKSDHSGSDRYQDKAKWRNGVLVIRVSHLTDRVREAIKTVIPAGIKYYFELDVSMGGGDGENGSITYGEVNVFEDNLFNNEIMIKNFIEGLTHSVNTPGRNYRSGRQLLYMGEEYELMSGVSFLGQNIINDISKIEVELEMNKSYRGLPKRSENTSRRSGRYAMSGTYTREIDMLSEVYEIYPSVKIYDVVEVKDKKVGDLIKNYNAPIEIEKERR